MPSHLVVVRDAPKARQSHEPLKSNDGRWHQMSNGTHAMPLQPPPAAWPGQAEAAGGR